MEVATLDKFIYTLWIELGPTGTVHGIFTFFLFTYDKHKFRD